MSNGNAHEVKAPSVTYSDSWDITFGPCDPQNPGFGYEIHIQRNGRTVLKTATHPMSGKDLDYATCLEVASNYGPRKVG